MGPGTTSLAERLLPATPSSTGKRTTLRYLAGFAASLAFLLLTPAGWSHLSHVWAEDGALFLLESITKPFWTTVFDPYQGYLHTLPRLCAELASVLPLEWAAAVLAISAAVLRAVVALIVFAGSGGIVRSLPVRFALAAVVIVLPAGNTETLDNIANLHWFLVYGVFWALFWRPEKRWQAAAGAVFVALAGATSPLVLFLLPVAAVRLLLRGWRDRTITIGFFAGFAAQACAVLFSDPRTYSPPPADPLHVVLAGLLRGPVVAFVGSERVEQLSALVGYRPLVLGAALVIAVPVVFALVWGSTAHRFVVVLAVGLSVLVMGANLIANWRDALEIQNFMMVMFAQRYSITTCLFLYAAMAMGLDTLKQPRWARVTTLTVRALVAVAVVVSIGLHATVPARRVVGTPLGGKLDGLPWGQSVAAAKASCAKGVPAALVFHEPDGWAVLLPCKYLLN